MDNVILEIFNDREYRRFVLSGDEGLLDHLAQEDQDHLDSYWGNEIEKIEGKRIKGHFKG